EVQTAEGPRTLHCQLEVVARGARTLVRVTGLRILVADDQEPVREAVRRMLERRGVYVVLAENGLDAEQRLREERFHLAMLDVAMPGRCGFDVPVTARARQREIPVIIMSAEPHDGGVARMKPD